MSLINLPRTTLDDKKEKETEETRGYERTYVRTYVNTKILKHLNTVTVLKIKKPFLFT